MTVLKRDYLEFGFYVGHYGSDQRERFLNNCSRYREGLVALLGPTMGECGNKTWNYGSIALHVPIGVGQHADPDTLRTLAERTSYHLKELGLARASVKGHREVGASECPGDHLMDDFIIPYRAGNYWGREPREPDSKGFVAVGSDQ